MLFTRGVSGTRVVTGKDSKIIGNLYIFLFCVISMLQVVFTLKAGELTLPPAARLTSLQQLP